MYMNDWDKVATHFLSIPMAHQFIGDYTIADAKDEQLKVLRSYQYYAVNKIADTGGKNRLDGGQSARRLYLAYHRLGQNDVEF